MLTAPRTPSTAAALLRLLALWLAAILLAQGVAAAVARAAGPLHRHTAAPLAMAPLLLSHHALHALHAHQHASGERHHHGAADATVERDAAAEAAFDEASLALAAALALLALGVAHAAAAARGRAVWRAAAAWAFRAAPLALPFKPPRLA